MPEVSEGDARRLVRAAGILGDRHSPEALDRLTDLPPGVVASALMVEKVTSLVLARLTAAGSPLAERLFDHPRFVTIRRRRDLLVRTDEEILGTVHERAVGLGLPVWGMKGLSARRRYPEPRLRDLGDLDLMVPGLDDAIRLTGELRELGYGFNRHEFPWIKRAPDSGHLYGQFNLHSRTPGRWPGIDLHFGGYSVRHCGLYRLPALDTTPGLSYLNVARNLPMMVANAAGDHRITTKDLNDLALAMDDQQVDWPHLLEELDAVCLTGFFAALVDALRATPLGDTGPAGKLADLVSGIRRERPDPAGDWSNRRRWAATVAHSFAYGRRRSPGGAIVATLTAARYYARPLRLRAGYGIGTTRLPRPAGWRCVRLVPVELLGRALRRDDDVPLGDAFLDLGEAGQRLSEDCTVMSSPRGQFVRMPIGDFLPTVYYRLARPLVAVAAAGVAPR